MNFRIQIFSIQIMILKYYYYFYYYLKKYENLMKILKILTVIIEIKCPVIIIIWRLTVNIITHTKLIC